MHDVCDFHHRNNFFRASRRKTTYFGNIFKENPQIFTRPKLILPHFVWWKFHTHSPSCICCLFTAGSGRRNYWLSVSFILYDLLKKPMIKVRRKMGKKIDKNFQNHRVRVKLRSQIWQQYFWKIQLVNPSTLRLPLLQKYAKNIRCLKKVSVLGFFCCNIMRFS